MLEQLAPATEGAVVNPGRKRRGRRVFGDDTGEPRSHPARTAAPSREQLVVGAVLDPRGFAEVFSETKVHILDKDHIDRYSPRAMAARELLNVRDTARALGVHENTIRNWEARGLLRAARLPGSGFRRFASADVERLRREMFDQMAPATEGPVVNPGRRRSGRLVFGDANE